MAAAVTLAGGSAGMMAQAAPAGPPKVLVTQVSHYPGWTGGEGWVVRDPRDPKHVSAAWHSGPTYADPNRASWCAFAHSSDGGKTWKQQLPPFTQSEGGPVTIQRTVVAGKSPGQTCGDTMISVGPNGALTLIGNIVGSDNFEQAMMSRDHGRTWSKPSVPFSAATTGQTSSSTPGSISTGPGRAFSAADPQTGQVVAALQGDFTPAGRYIAVSDDSGLTWSPPRAVTLNAPAGAGVGAPTAAHGVIGAAYTLDPASPGFRAFPEVPCQSTCAVLALTRDKGKTWTRHVVTQSLGGPGVGLGGRLAPAADPAHKGTFAVMLGRGSTQEVWVTHNGGKSFRKIHTITPPAGDSISKPWINYSYTGSGALAVYWRAPHADGTTSIMVAVARDGKKFSKPVVVRKAVPADGSGAFMGAGDDCACYLHLDDTTVSVTWGEYQPTTGQKELYFGTFNYTKL